MPDRIAGYVRTYWPLLLGHLAAILTAWLARHLGLTIDSTIAYEGLALGLSGAVYAAGRWLEVRPGTSLPARAARWVGHWLLSLGLPTGPPSYPLTTGDSPPLGSTIERGDDDRPQSPR
jgi:hypothetical protein